MALTEGSILGHYRILGPLGSGGMGEVYRAHDENLGRDVAVKVLPEEVVRDPEARARFEREARTVAALSHPNILTIHDFGSDGRVAYAVTELLEGEDLRSRLAREGALSLDQTLEVASAVARGLAAAHAKGVVHRDIKPGNVFLTASGGVKVLDFGLARAVVATDDADDDSETLQARTRPGMVMGTIGYMSPEQARGQVAGPASDVFSFGCLLYEMVAGNRPFDRGSTTDTLAAILRDEPKPPEQIRTREGRSLAPILERCLKKVPAERFADGEALSAQIERLRESRHLESVEGAAALHLLRRPAVAIPIVLLLVLAGFLLLRSSQRRAAERWAREEALPQVRELADRNDFLGAFVLAEQVEEVLPTDPLLEELWNRISTPMTVRSEPEGAVVFYKPYAEAGGEWQELGTTPIEGVRLPRGPFRWRVERVGYEPRELARRVPSRSQIEDAPAVAGARPANEIQLLLDAEGETVPGMVAVEGGLYLLVPLTGFPVALGQGVMLDRYWIDRTEVTNQAYRDFVDAGGYSRPEFWREPFVEGARTLSFEEAMARFRDPTDRPGPMTWSVGAPPEGAESLPVGGVSWFEAAAYCEFREGALPSVVHWVRAVLPALEIAEPMSPSIVPLSNFGGEGPAPVASYPSLGESGTYDQAGNLREWVYNARGADLRYALGGGWSDPAYRFSQAEAQDPWERREVNGFRCARFVEGEPPPELLTPFDVPTTDYRAVPRIPDAVLATLAQPLRYDPAPLRISEVSSEQRSDRILERVEIDAAYRSERLPVRIHLPLQRSPPYQAIVVAPGLDVTFRADYEELAGYDVWSSLVRSGRVLVEPIYAGTLDRNDGSTSVRIAQPAAAAALLTDWSRDVSRTLDYLAERGDIDMDAVGYLGFSLGSVLAARILPFEERIAVAVFVSGGLSPSIQGEALIGTMAGVRHTRTPLLMLNGRYDTTFPSGSHAQPLLDEWGAAPDDKRIRFFDAGHWPLPAGEVLREALDWYDRFLGPVTSASGTTTAP